jgi:predicted DsbA family dithiol-disulfide isomerase
MSKLQFFYGYECPFCKRGYEHLMEQIADHREIEIEWIPVEVDPGSDLSCQSYYIAKELGADIDAFHKAMYRAVSVEGRNAENPEVLCNILEGIVDTDKFRAILESGKYSKQTKENNDLAYEKSGVWYVPALRMNGKKLDARGGAGISPAELRNFLNS